MAAARERTVNVPPVYFLVALIVLVVSGPCRFTRNPMYLGLAGTLLGAAVLMGSIALALGRRSPSENLKKRGVRCLST